jgi:hypothetical protein
MVKRKKKLREGRMGDMNQENGGDTKKRGLSPIILIFGRLAVKREISLMLGVEPSQAPSSLFSVFKDFRWTWGMVILVLLHTYAYRPIEPKMPADSELLVVDGLPKYVSTNAATISGYAFKVDGMKLNCELGTLSGGSGCEYIGQAVDITQSARATYFWMPTRLWYGYKYLHTLEQRGRLILSPDQSHAHAMKSYRALWVVYRELSWLWIVFAIVTWLLEGLGIIYIIKKSGE